MKSVLLIGEDAPLLASRAALLQHIGASVTFCYPADFEERAAESTYSLFVLCHTLDADTRHSIAVSVHQRWPGSKVLQLVSDFCGCSTQPDTDADAVSTAIPATLVQRTRELLGSGDLS